MNIVEPLWGVPTDMDPHNKERFFDGSIVIHRHLDRLLVHGNETDKVNARTEVITSVVAYSFQGLTDFL